MWKSELQVRDFPAVLVGALELRPLRSSEAIHVFVVDNVHFH